MTIIFYSDSTVGYLTVEPCVPGRTSIGLDVLGDTVELFLILRQYPQQGAVISDNIEPWMIFLILVSSI